MGKDKMGKDEDLSFLAFLRVIRARLGTKLRETGKDFKKNRFLQRSLVGWISYCVGIFLTFKIHPIFCLPVIFGLFYSAYAIWRNEKEWSLKWDREAEKKE